MHGESSTWSWWMDRESWLQAQFHIWILIELFRIYLSRQNIDLSMAIENRCLFYAFHLHVSAERTSNLRCHFRWSQMVNFSAFDGWNIGRRNLHHFLASDYLELFRIYLFPKVWIRWGVKELYLLYNSLLWRLMVNDGNLAMVAIWNAVVGWTMHNINSNNG